MPDERKCVVCGAKSHREDWINKSGNEVACDQHTAAEVAKAIAAKQLKAAAQTQQVKPPVTTVPPSTTTVGGVAGAPKTETPKTP
jgi:hypothetical protein